MSPKIKSLFFLAPLFMMGCANLDEMTNEERVAYLDKKEESRYQREVDLIEAREEFQWRQAACMKNGGVMVIPRRNRISRHGMPSRETKDEYVHAACMRL